MIVRALMAGLVTLGLVMSAAGQTTQPAKAATKPTTKPVTDGVKSFALFAPADAMVFVESAGRDAAGEVFGASHLGQMVNDPAIGPFFSQFVRAKLLEWFTEQLLDPRGTTVSDEQRAMIEQLLAPFWDKPTAMFLLPPSDRTAEGSSDVGLLCAIPGTERKELQSALDMWLREVIRGHSYDWSTGTLTWHGVAFGRGGGGELPTEASELAAALSERYTLLFCWTEKYLLIATSLEAASAWEKGLAAVGGEDSLAMEADFQDVMAKADTDNWAVRWYVNAASIGRAVAQEHGADFGARTKRLVFALGLQNVRAVGGMLGCEDNTVAYRTYVLAPQTDGGLLKLFKTGGSHKPALAMVPRNATAAVAGQVDLESVAAMIRETVRFSEAVRSGDDSDEEVLSELDATLLEKIDAIAAGCDGNTAVFVGAVNLLNMRSGSPPVGLVLGMKDAKAAADALASIRVMIATMNEGSVPSREPAARPYRDVVIYPLGGTLAYAADMEDRLILSTSQTAVRQAIDAAKEADEKGGFAADSKGAAYLALAGDGGGVFFVDLAGPVKNFWPMARPVIAKEMPDADLLPNTETLLEFLGPEVAVFESDADGLRIKSAGLLPFFTHLVVLLLFAA